MILPHMRECRWLQRQLTVSHLVQVTDKRTLRFQSCLLTHTSTAKSSLQAAPRWRLRTTLYDYHVVTADQNRAAMAEGSSNSLDCHCWHVLTMVSTETPRKTDGVLDGLQDSEKDAATGFNRVRVAIIRAVRGTKGVSDGVQGSQNTAPTGQPAPTVFKRFPPKVRNRIYGEVSNGKCGRLARDRLQGVLASELLERHSMEPPIPQIEANGAHTDRDPAGEPTD
jgi:hypothetical protein